MRGRPLVYSIFRNYSVYIAFVLVLIVAGLLSKGVFTRPTNLWAVILRSSILGLVSLGQMLVIITGGIDLSVGSMFSFSLTIMALGELAKMNPYFAIAIAIGGGTLAGLANGIIIVTTNIYPFVVTFATMMMLESFNLTILGAAAFNFPTVQGALLNIMTFLHLDETILSVGIWVIATAIIFFLCRYSVFGHNLYAVGGNPTASAFSGVNTKRIKMLSYATSGFLSALAAVMAAYRLGGANVGAGAEYQLNSIAAAVVGGASLYGGVGDPLGVAIGSIVIAMLLNIMNILNVDPFIQNSVEGIIILAYVAFSNYLRKIKLETLRG